MLAKILTLGVFALDILDSLKDYDITVAVDKEEFCRQLDKDSSFDVFLLDMNNDVYDGLDILKQIKNREHLTDISIIVISDKLEDENAYTALGVSDIIRKPINIYALKLAIDTQTQLSKYKRIISDGIYRHDEGLDAIFNQAQIGIAICGSHDEYNYRQHSNILSVNKIFEQTVGRTQRELNSISWEDMTHPEDIEQDKEYFRKLCQGEINRYSMNKRYIRPDGSVIWVYMAIVLLNISNDYKHNYICLIRDISERKAIEEQLTESERSKSTFLSNIPGMAFRCSVDSLWTMHFISDGCYALTGYEIDELLNNNVIPFVDIIKPKYRKTLEQKWAKMLARQRSFKHEYEITTKTGETKWVMEIGRGIYDDSGNVQALEGIIYDITEQKEKDRHLEYIAKYDALTGLLNRGQLEDLLNREHKRSKNAKRALICINAKKIYLLSLAYGFNYSQALVKRLADALKKHCNSRCLLFKTQEQRFTFYTKGYRSQKELASLVQSIIKTLENMLAVDRISVGIGVYEMNSATDKVYSMSLQKVLIASEKAIDMSERDCNYLFYDEELEYQVKREESIKKELVQIAKKKDTERLYLHFQPIVDLHTGRICSFEALARLNSYSHGKITPVEFIPIAERNKLIIPLGQQIITMALDFLAELEKNGYNDIKVFINISAQELSNNDFGRNLIRAIENAKVNAENVGIEITESAFEYNYQNIKVMLDRLSAYGVQIAIDDFGTGYSSLAREWELSVEYLKIDKFFIDKLHTQNDNKSIISDIISISHKLGQYVVAEGVEYENQRQYLEANGCDKIQGYLISPAVDSQKAMALLLQYNN